MFETIPVPGQSKFGAEVARRLNAIRPIAPAGALAMTGATGTGFAPLPANLRDRRAIAADPLHPWKVFAVGKSEDVNHFFEIYIPAGSVIAGAKAIEVEGIEETETEKRFTFECETDVGEDSTLYLVVYRDEEEKSGASGSDDDERNYKSVLAVNIDEYEDDETVRAIIPIAELAVVEGEDYDKGKVVSQIEKQAIRIDDLEVPTDNVSIAKVTKEDAEDPAAIQVMDFDNEESDGGQGLAERLELEKSGSGESATYKIVAKSNASKVHLVARVNGKIKYIPISGKEEKDPDEKTGPGDGDPNSNCNDHPGSEDGGGAAAPEFDGPGVYGGGVEGGSDEGSSGVGCDC